MSTRDAGFLRLWGAVSLSQLGDRISELALPLIAAGLLHASTAEVATLTALIWAPNLLAILLGAWVDQQRRKRRLLVAADLTRALAFATLPIAYLLDTVTLGHLYTVAVITGAAGMLFNNAYAPFFARLVPRRSYIDANSKLSTSRSVSYVAGPAIGGALVQTLTAPIAVLADALSFLVSALLIGRIRVDEPPAVPSAEPPVLTRARQGLRLVVSHPILRASLGCCTTVNFFTFMASGLTVLFASRTLELSAGTIGLALGIGAIGSLIGAVTAPRISRHLGVGRTIAVGVVLYAAPTALIATAAGPLGVRFSALATAEFISGFGVMLFDINLNSLQTTVVPDTMRSRTAGAFSTINYGVRPAGALVGGLLATVIGMRPSLLTAAAGGALSVLWLLPSPILRIRSLEATDLMSNAAT
ncbi:MFS transporter [Actinoplanes sp. NPDC020271]|uniref:MFS transporter n=1 Tax=Actinoplanes sp. NPDC020271 TaxID=3363896 RepID=UPI0037937A20